MRQWSVTQGDCIAVMRTLADGCVDSVVTDPPYELGFMEKTWDRSGIANSVEMWREVFRVLKPGGHLVSFGATRTYHRMACAIEDAGFEIRDSIDWIYGSGFPKSLNVSKAIDKSPARSRNGSQSSPTVHAPATARATQWEGWGTALKPAHEPAVLARKPLAGTVAANVQAHGTGALNIDGCRLPMSDADAINGMGGYGKPGARQDGQIFDFSIGGMKNMGGNAHEQGRWPANIILSESAAADLNEMTSNAVDPEDVGAARYFYCPKPDGAERDAGCESLPWATPEERVGRNNQNKGINSPRAGAGRTHGGHNTHPTVKPIDLMRYLCRLVTPPGGVVLDPFCGSGTTGVAAVLEGFDFLGIDLEINHCRIAEARIKWWSTRSVAPVGKASAVKATDSNQPELF